MFMTLDNKGPGLFHEKIKRKLCYGLMDIALLAISGCSRNNANPPMHSPKTHSIESPYNIPPITASATPGSNITEPPLIEVSDSDMVNVIDYIPSIYIDLKYATEDNFTGSVIDDFTDAFLRYGTVKKLAQVQENLLEQGFSLKIWDAYRPVSAQFKLWEIFPDPIYVANPSTGYSSHSRGNTLDVTIVMADGSEIEIPTGFDDFSAMADRDYSDVEEPARSNVLLLENAMSSGEFNGYFGEWWHFSDSISHPVIE